MISLEPHWIVLDGMSYGLNQPVMSGILNVQLSKKSSISALKNIIRMWIDIDINIQIDESDSIYSQEELLIRHLLVWQSRIQQQHKIPTFDKNFIRVIQKKDKPNTTKLFIVIPYSIPEITRDILTCVIHVVNYSLENIEVLKECDENDIKTYFAEATVHLDNLRTQLNKVQLSGMNTYWFMHAANTLGMHVSHIAQNTFSFGTGASSILLDSSFTENTSVIGSKLSKSKSATAQLLHKCGLPAATHVALQSEKQLSQLTKEMGFPLVIKPDNLDQGSGVFAYLTSLEQVKKAFKAAYKLSKQVLLEKHVIGDDYRITVLNSQVIKIVKRTAAGVIGDGRLTIRQLLSNELQSPYAQEVYRQTKKQIISLDDEARELLCAQSVTPDTVPLLGQYIALRRKNNMSTGGSVKAIDINDVHPDNISLAVRAATAANLDLAGVDLIIQDIKSSWLNTDAIICEINAQPQIGATIKPEIYQKILLSLLKNRVGIPVHLFILPEQPNEADMDIFRPIIEDHNANAVSSKFGIYVNNNKVSKPFINGFVALKALILQKDAYCAAAFMSHKEIELMGLPLARFESILFCINGHTANELEQKLVKMVEPHSDNFTLIPRSKMNEL